MSIFSNIGHAISKGVKDVGHVAGKVLSNPVVDAGLSFIPGVGPVAAGAAGALGNLIKPGGNLGAAIKGGGMGALAGMAGPMLGGALSHIPGASAVEGALSHIPGAGAIGSAAQRLGGALSSITGGSGAPGAGGIGGVVGKAIDYAKSNPNMILAGAGALNAANESKRASDLEKQGIQSAQGAYDARAPLRAQALSRMQAIPGMASTSAIPYQSAGNPYSRQRALPLSQAGAQ